MIEQMVGDGRCDDGRHYWGGSTSFNLYCETFNFDGGDCEGMQVDCVGDWSAWTPCSISCGASGSQQRIYEITTHAMGKGENCPYQNGKSMTKSCNDGPCPIDCQGEWSTFGECSLSCGSGQHSSTFEVQSNAEFGGIECKASDGTIKTQSCQTQPCPVPCDYSWSEWTACGNTCGTGQQTRTAIIDTPALYGGDCPFDDTSQVEYIEYRSCVQPDCLNCTGTWSSWGDSGCTTSCGGGVEIRTFSVIPEVCSSNCYF